MSNLPFAELNDDRSKFSFKKLTNMSECRENFWNCSWEELHDLRSSLKKGLDHILNIAQKEKRDLSDDEEAAFEYGNAYLDAVSEQFNLRSKNDTKNPVDPHKIINPLPAGVMMGGAAHGGENRVLTNPRSFRSMFYQDERAKLDKRDFADFREYLSVFLGGKYDPRMEALQREARTMMEKDGVSGGFAVPTELAAVLMDTSLESEIIRSRANVTPMQSAVKVIPAFESKDHTNLFGGLGIEWIGEGQTATIQDAKLRDLTLEANAGVIYLNASMEVLMDASSFESHLKNVMGKSMGAGLDYSFIQGNGIKKPLGILNCDSALAINRASANAIGYTDLTSMYSRMLPAFRQNAVWLVTGDAIDDLMGIVPTNTNELLWKPGQPLLGKPVIETEKLPTLGAKGDIVLVDLSQYAIGMRQEIVFDQTNAAYWRERLISFRCILRVDGRPLWNGPITPMNGGPTQSWCTILDVPA